MVLNEVPTRELVIELVGCTVIIGLAALLAVQGARRITESSVHPALPTSIVVWVLVIAAFAAFTPMRALVYWSADVAPLWVLATLGLACPLAPPGPDRGRRFGGGRDGDDRAVCPQPGLVDRWRLPIVAGSLVIAAVAVIHLRPVYLSLRDQSAPSQSS